MKVIQKPIERINILSNGPEADKKKSRSKSSPALRNMCKFLKQAGEKTEEGDRGSVSRLGGPSCEFKASRKGDYHGLETVAEEVDWGERNINETSSKLEVGIGKRATEKRSSHSHIKKPVAHGRNCPDDEKHKRTKDGGAQKHRGEHVQVFNKRGDNLPLKKSESCESAFAEICNEGSHRCLRMQRGRLSKEDSWTDIEKHNHSVDHHKMSSHSNNGFSEQSTCPKPKDAGLCVDLTEKTHSNSSLFMNYLLLLKLINEERKRMRKYNLRFRGLGSADSFFLQDNHRRDEDIFLLKILCIIFLAFSLVIMKVWISHQPFCMWNYIPKYFPFYHQRKAVLRSIFDKFFAAVSRIML